MREQGVVQAITLRPDEDQIVAGDRRFRATTKVAELIQTPLTEATIPAIIRNYSDSQSLEAMATENLHRDDFTPLEEANFFAQRLADMKDTPDSYKVLSKTYGLEESAIRLRIALLSLPQAIRTAFDAGKITIGHACRKDWPRLLRHGTRSKVLLCHRQPRKQTLNLQGLQ